MKLYFYSAITCECFYKNIKDFFNDDNDYCIRWKGQIIPMKLKYNFILDHLGTYVGFSEFTNRQKQLLKKRHIKYITTKTWLR